MRLKLLGAASLLALTAFTGVAAAGDPPGYYAAGHGQYLTETFRFAVRSDLSLGHVSGSLELTRGIYVFKATATCLAKAPDEVTTGYAITDGATRGQGFEAAVRSGSTTSSPPAQVLWYEFLPAAPTTCASPSTVPAGATPGGAIQEGRITIHTRS